MGCGCNKSKCEGTDCKNTMNINNDNTPKDNIPEWVAPNPPEFKQRQVEQPSISKSIGMAKSFISSIASRGTNNEKVSIPLKQLRVLSCFGNKDKGGQLPPCEFLRKSTTEGKFFCGGCGCGDKKLTWLNGTDTEYSKLDYPKLACPLQMPGFTNYKESPEAESVPPITRRAYIEKMNYDQLKVVDVTTPENPD